MTPEQKERADRLFKQQQEAVEATAEYRKHEEAVRLRTARLRAERLAREAADLLKSKKE